MTDYKTLNKLLQFYIDYDGAVPYHPDLAIKDAGINIDKKTAFLMCAMMRNDGYLYKPRSPKSDSTESKGYLANYKAKLFLDEGGYVTLKRVADRKKAVSWMIDHFDFLKYPIGILISLFVLYKLLIEFEFI